MSCSQTPAVVVSVEVFVLVFVNILVSFLFSLSFLPIRSHQSFRSARDLSVCSPTLHFPHHHMFLLFAFGESRRGCSEAVAAGAYHTCAVKENGQLVCWGLSSLGQCAVPRALGPVTAVASECVPHSCRESRWRVDVFRWEWRGAVCCSWQHRSGRCHEPVPETVDVHKNYGDVNTHSRHGADCVRRAIPGEDWQGLVTQLEPNHFWCLFPGHAHIT